MSRPQWKHSPVGRASVVKQLHTREAENIEDSVTASRAPGMGKKDGVWASKQTCCAATGGVARNQLPRADYTVDLDRRSTHEHLERIEGLLLKEACLLVGRQCVLTTNGTAIRHLERVSMHRPQRRACRSSTAGSGRRRPVDTMSSQGKWQAGRRALCASPHCPRVPWFVRALPTSFSRLLWLHMPPNGRRACVPRGAGACSLVRRLHMGEVAAPVRRSHPRQAHNLH